MGLAFTDLLPSGPRFVEVIIPAAYKAPLNALKSIVEASLPPELGAYSRSRVVTAVMAYWAIDQNDIGSFRLDTADVEVLKERWASHADEIPEVVNVIRSIVSELQSRGRLSRQQ